MIALFLCGFIFSSSRIVIVCKVEILRHNSSLPHHKQARQWFILLHDKPPACMIVHGVFARNVWYMMFGIHNVRWYSHRIKQNAGCPKRLRKFYTDRKCCKIVALCSQRWRVSVWLGWTIITRLINCDTARLSTTLWPTYIVWSNIYEDYMALRWLQQLWIMVIGQRKQVTMDSTKIASGNISHKLKPGYVAIKSSYLSSQYFMQCCLIITIEAWK